MTVEKVDLGRKSLTYSHVQIFLGICKRALPVYFFYSKHDSRSIREIFRELASTPLPVKSGALIIWSKFFNIIDSQDICEYSALWKKSHHLGLHLVSPHISVPAVFWCTMYYPTVKNQCVSSSHTVIPGEHGRYCEAHLLLDYKYLMFKIYPICFGAVWPTCFQKCLNWLTALFISIYACRNLKPSSFLNQCALVFIYWFLNEEICYVSFVPTNPLYSNIKLKWSPLLLITVILIQSLAKLLKISVL